MNRFEERPGLVKHMASGPGTGKIKAAEYLVRVLLKW